MDNDSSFDIIIVGAGLSGINAAYRLQQQLPHHRFTILEARDVMGGTWAYWKYPGIRSDSAMGVFGFPWHPWPYDTNMAAAEDIHRYLEDAATSQGIDKKIRFGHRCKAASWSSEEQRWTLSVDVAGADGDVSTKEFKAWWLISAGGYYSYEKPMPAVIPGIENFKGEVVHPQFWDNSKHDYAGKKMVIIGSGATAVTLLPALAKTAKSVTMLQRSPSYVFSLPARDRIVPIARMLLPLSWATWLVWWKTMFTETLFVAFVKNFPTAARKMVMGAMKAQLPKGFDLDKHFNPSYPVFDQRLCLCPDGDFFKALRQGNCDVVTDTIETVTERGILLKSGQELQADMIITATGLFVLVLAGIPILVDGERIDQKINQRYLWNGTLLEGVPNSGAITGYTAGTWTPGADARTQTVIKVIKHMEKTGATAGMPYLNKEERERLPKKPALKNSSTYLVNARERLPITADVGPWRNGTSWVIDMFYLLFGSAKSGMKYTVPVKAKRV
ncbi:hypothetical protein QBC46DRAFT_395163 [Diplogelasinospora grovesii]|uniref:Monooxygenase n=1 Tax=Diplogelasinospora grovesii TaxID=303347 RepID=A0AAN6S1K2_9PEZI|nr:hypothetical protein QBC46DRAFT_395163 [Diplogelasinospora grovesii]